ncbi:DUF397 domain-containing protein [Streptomyces sp. ACA25]|nr:DUF397 domain-containing protein [Streptomyces sp. ACA25]MDB1090176.1 DUF397 domain-containing protein [Streptomyces sp. ACA25]
MRAQTNAQASQWFKSSHSGGNATECVEAARLPDGLMVRDSKACTGPVVGFSAAAWSAFVSHLTRLD